VNNKKRSQPRTQVLGSKLKSVKTDFSFLKIVFNPFQRVLALSHEIDLMAYPELRLTNERSLTMLD